MTQVPLMDRIHITEDYDVPRVINGGWQLSAGHALERPLDLADASRAFNRLIDMGFDTFDCADIYTASRTSSAASSASAGRRGFACRRFTRSSCPTSTTSRT